jgi:hypothetical protein
MDRQGWIRFFTGVTSSTLQEELERTERLRRKGPAWAAMRGAAIGTAVGVVLLGLRTLVDLGAGSPHRPEIYLISVLVIAAAGGTVALLLYGGRMVWYRSAKEGSESPLEQHWREARKRQQEQVIEQGATRFVLFGALSGGLLWALLEHGSLSPPGIEAAFGEFLATFLEGALVTGVGGAIYAWKVVNRPDEEEEEAGHRGT